jgi:hypothetical protein
VDARDNTSTNPSTDGTGVPIYNLNGERIADDYADLWDGSLDIRIRYDQTGSAVVNPAAAWTGSATDGTERNDGSDRGLGNTNGTYSYLGQPNLSTSLWIADASAVLNTNHRLYAMSGILVNGQKIPEPGSLGLGLVIAMAAGGWWVVRRQRKPAAFADPSQS